MNIKVKVNETVYEVEIDDLATRPIMARIGGESFEIWPEEISTPVTPAQPRKSHPAATGMQTDSKERVILAPLPGTITQVFVQPGKKIETGDPLLVIEAMKMKNTIRSGRNGILASVLVNTGDTVKHHQAILEFTE
jgi:biotin carboxyl carrier protein